MKVNSTVLPLFLAMGAIPKAELPIIIILAIVVVVLLIINIIYAMMKPKAQAVATDAQGTTIINNTYNVFINNALQEDEEEIVSIPEEVEVVEEDNNLLIAAEASDDEEETVEQVWDEETGQFILVRYNRSFISRVIQAKDNVKSYYSELKNEILSYEKVKIRLSWKHEIFKQGRNSLIRMTMRGKTLCLYFALDPNDYVDSKYKVEDASGKAITANYPCLYRITSDLRCRYAKDLIAQVMEKFGLAKTEIEPIDYASLNPYEEDQPLIERGLIKVIGEPANPVQYPEYNNTSEDIVEEIVSIPEEVEVVEEDNNLLIAAEASDDEEETVEQVWDEETGQFILVRYNRSFISRVIQAKDNVKSYYSELKNEILSYEKVKIRLSWKHEIFKQGRNSLIRMTMRGKTLCLYFALDPNDYVDSKYKVEDASGKAITANYPCLYRITSDLRCRYAKDLIAQVMEKFGLAKTEIEPIDYASLNPYEEDQPLIERGLIKVIGEPANPVQYPEYNNTSEDIVEEIVEYVDEDGNVVEVEEIVIDPQLEEAEEVVVDTEIEEAEEIVVDTKTEEADEEIIVNDPNVTEPKVTGTIFKSSKRFNRNIKGKTAYINLDVLDKYFNDDEEVTLDSIKTRVPQFMKNATAYKVLARGKFNKRLIIIANDFSNDAIRKIKTLGGEVHYSVVKTK